MFVAAGDACAGLLAVSGVLQWQSSSLPVFLHMLNGLHNLSIDRWRAVHRQAKGLVEYEAGWELLRGCA